MAENEDLSYLDTGISTEDKGVLKNLSAMGEQLKKLQLKMLEAQAAADAAKKEYEHYATKRGSDKNSGRLCDIRLHQQKRQTNKRQRYREFNSLYARAFKRLGRRLCGIWDISRVQRPICTSRFL